MIAGYNFSGLSKFARQHGLDPEKTPIDSFAIEIVPGGGQWRVWYQIRLDDGSRTGMMTFTTPVQPPPFFIVV